MTTDYCPECGDSGLPNDEGEHRCVNVLCACLWQPIPKREQGYTRLMAVANRGTRRREGER
jgi:hypothetical protein